ncbi:hypothetical protein FJZ40_01180 [Candidatus Shapirobacteria bacterium]|nr:hypothetical protein [Chloroflexota bacterium]MBM3208893.1 hypothetical protein [Candidatus Shapirobacteria bacterium]
MRNMNKYWAKGNFWWGMISYLFLIGGLVAGTVLTSQRQIMTEKATLEPKATTQAAIGANANLSLALAPGTTAVPVGQEFDAYVSLNTDGAAAIAADLAITFDKTKLQLVSVTPQSPGNLKTFTPSDANGDFSLNSPANIAKANDTGRIEFGASSFDWETTAVLDGYNGSGALANLRFKALSRPGAATIGFDFANNSLIEQDTKNSILVKANNLSFNIDCPFSGKVSIKDQNGNLITDPPAPGFSITSVVTDANGQPVGQATPAPQIISGGTFSTSLNLPQSYLNATAAVTLSYPDNYRIANTWCVNTGEGGCPALSPAAATLRGFKMVCGAKYDYGWGLRPCVENYEGVGGPDEKSLCCSKHCLPIAGAGICLCLPQGTTSVPPGTYSLPAPLPSPSSLKSGSQEIPAADITDFDLNHDKKLNSLDWGILVERWNQGLVNAIDVSRFLSAWASQKTS